MTKEIINKNPLQGPIKFKIKNSKNIISEIKPGEWEFTGDDHEEEHEFFDYFSDTFKNKVGCYLMNTFFRYTELSTSIKIKKDELFLHLQFDDQVEFNINLIDLICYDVHDEWVDKEKTIKTLEKLITKLKNLKEKNKIRRA